MKPPPTKTVHRSSESGQFVTKRDAETHKRTTETERVSVAKPAAKSTRSK